MYFLKFNLMTHMSIHVSIEHRVLNTAGFLICMNFCINDTCQAVCCDKKPTYMRKDSKGFLFMRDSQNVKFC